ncbi:MAG: 3-isopropylmalate dehydrogenase [bacterium]|nr:3-isopropylmalate dehydrogenase [bacterium]
MSQTIFNIAVLPGDGVGKEVTEQSVLLLKTLARQENFVLKITEGLVGGIAFENTGSPLPEETLNLAKESDAILLGAVGGPQWETLTYERRPERALLSLRKELGLFANLRPAFTFNELANASSLKKEIISNTDLMVVRELTGGIYFGEPRGDDIQNGKRVSKNTLIYSEDEIQRIAHVAFQIAQKRNKKLCSVDKANVLETTELWRQIVTEVHQDYADVVLTHMYIDNAAMQLVHNPKQFDVMVTTNMFGDILSDIAAMLTGSIGMLPSASLNETHKGLYEPVHGSAPDIAGKDVANPLASILSVAMMFQYSFNDHKTARKIIAAVQKVLSQKFRTTDIFEKGTKQIGCKEMGALVIENLE